MSILFTETTHALLFAWVTRAVVREAGRERGEQVIHLAVRRYGEQRGRRMAARARRDGVELSMAAFLAYTEYRLVTDLRKQELSQSGQDVHTTMLQCPWDQTWKQNGLIEYGRLYCREIDHAVLRGFNPALRLEVNHTLANDGLPCETTFFAGAASPSPQPSQPFARPWDYHVGHLYASLCAVLKQELGEAGARAAQEGLQELAARFGSEATRLVSDYLEVDFDAI
jgi:hypothetical protein